MERPSSSFDDWMEQQIEANQNRFKPILSQAGIRIDTSINQGYGSYELSVEEVIQRFTPVNVALFRSIWRSREGYGEQPKNMTCAFSKSVGHGNVELHSARFRFNPYHIQYQGGPADMNFADVEVIFSNRLAVLEVPKQTLWNPQDLGRLPLNRNINEVLARNPDIRVNLAVMLVDDATNPATLAVASKK